MSVTTPLRVLVGDDDFLVREGLIRALDEDPRVDVVGAEGDADALAAAVERLDPDVVVTDIRMPPTKTDEGIRAASEIQRRHPRMAVMLLSSHVDVENALELFGGEPSGIGYLLKDRVTEVDDFLAAGRRVAGGGTAIDASILAELRSGLWSADAQAVIEAAATHAAVVGH